MTLEMCTDAALVCCEPHQHRPPSFTHFLVALTIPLAFRLLCFAFVVIAYPLCCMLTSSPEYGGLGSGRCHESGPTRCYFYKTR